MVSVKFTSIGVHREPMVQSVSSIPGKGSSVFHSDLLRPDFVFGSYRPEKRQNKWCHKRP